MTNLPEAQRRARQDPEDREAAARLERERERVDVKSCNRKACRATPAPYFNDSTRGYYCAYCASMINRMNGVRLCRLPSEERVWWP